MSITETDHAWAAGFFTSVGAVRPECYKKPRGRRKLNAYVTVEMSVMNDGRGESVRRFHHIVKVGRIFTRQYEDGANLILWRTSAVNDVATVRDLLWPYLGQYRREQWEWAQEQIDTVRRNPHRCPGAMKAHQSHE